MSSEPRRSPLEDDFSLDTAELVQEPGSSAAAPTTSSAEGRSQSQSTASSSAAQPVIVIQRSQPRRRWLRAALPAILLLLAALAVLRYRVGTADWRGLGPGGGGSGILGARPRQDGPAVAASPADTIAAVGAPATAPLAAVSPGDPVQAVSVDSVNDLASAATPLAEAAGNPAVAASAEPAPGAATGSGDPENVIVVEAAEPVGHDPTAPVRDFQAAQADLFRPMIAAARPDPVSAPPAPNPDVVAAPEAVDSDEVWGDIAQAAKQKAAERAELEGMKRDLLDRDRQEAAQRKLEQTVEEIKKQDDNRRVFLTDLKRLMQAGGPNLVESVRSMVDQSGGDASKLAADQPNRTKKLASSADLRHAWVKSLRRMGIAEGLILSDLERAHKLNYAARNGPRTPDEALLRAARDLLDVPLERLGQVRIVPAPAAAPATPARPGAGISRRR